MYICFTGEVQLTVNVIQHTVKCDIAITKHSCCILDETILFM